MTDTSQTQLAEGLNVYEWLNEAIKPPITPPTNAQASIEHLRASEKRANDLLINVLLKLKNHRKLFHRHVQELERNIPRVSYDLKQVERDVALLRVSLDGVTDTPPLAINESQVTVLQRLQELRKSKEREQMQRLAAEESEKWSSFPDEIAALLTAGEFTQAAARLKQAKASLLLELGEPTSVKSERQERLLEWQEKLAQMLIPSLSVAIEQRDSGACGKIYRLLEIADQVPVFSEYFETASSSVWLKRWSDHFANFKGNLTQQSVGKSAASIYILKQEDQAEEQTFFTNFFDSLLEFVANESGWLDSVLPLVDETLPGRFVLLEKFLWHMFQQLKPSFSEYLDFTLNTATPLGIAPPVIEHATKLFQSTIQYVYEVEKLPGFSGSYAQQLVSHFKRLQGRHAFYEEHQLQAQFRQILANIRKLQREDWPTFSSAFTRTVYPDIFSDVLLPIIERSFQLTFGLSICDCISVIDKFLPQLLDVCNSATTKFDDAGSRVEAGLVSVLSCCAETEERLRKLFELMQANLRHFFDLDETTGEGNLTFASPARPPFLPQLVPVMYSIDGAAIRKIASAGSFREILPQSTAQVTSWTKNVQSCVFDAFMAPIFKQLRSTTTVEDSEGPSPFITSIGEALLNLPQKLEAYASESSGLIFLPKSIPHLTESYYADQSEGVPASAEDRLALATHYWLSSVVLGTMEAISKCLYELQVSATQLRTDVGYLGNVISSLEIPFSDLFQVFYFLASSVAADEPLDKAIQRLGVQVDDDTCKRWIKKFYP